MIYLPNAYTEMQFVDQLFLNYVNRGSKEERLECGGLFTVFYIVYWADNDPRHRAEK